MPNDVSAFGEAITHAASSHEAILQSLNRWMEFEGGKRLFYGVENFEGTEPNWDNAPLIFAKNHPDVEQMRRIEGGEIDAVLEEMGGSICGKINSSSVVRAGQPRLTSQASFFDPAMEARYKKGELSLSTGFFCTPGNEGRIHGKVRPNHVLVFIQDERNQPRDLGAMFLNKKEENMTDAAVTHAGRVISEKNKSKFKAVMESLRSLYSEWTGEGEGNKCDDDDENKSSANADLTWKKKEEEKKKKAGSEGSGAAPAAANKDGDEMGDTDLKKELDLALIAKKEMETSLANKDAEIETLKKEKEALTNQVASFEQEKKDAAWTTFKNKLRPGFIPKPEDEAAKRKEFEDNPVGFMNAVLDHQMKPPTKEEGKTHTGEGDSAPKGIGVFNAKTLKWED